MVHLESLALILALPLGRGGAEMASANASQTVVTDVDGHRLSLLDQHTEAAVLFFVTNDCPISNSYAPEINRIAASYTPRKITFYAIYTDATVSIPEIRRHALEYGLKLPLIPDPAHSLVHLVGATMTPEAAVLGRAGRLVYRGPIDDLYFDFGKRRPEPTQSYVRQVLDAILSGKTVGLLSIKPIGRIGCFISKNP